MFKTATNIISESFCIESAITEFSFHIICFVFRCRLFLKNSSFILMTLMSIESESCGMFFFCTGNEQIAKANSLRRKCFFVVEEKKEFLEFSLICGAY